MSVSIRRVLTGFDRFSMILRGAYGKYTGVLIQWLPDTEECIAIAGLDDILGEVTPDDIMTLHTWTESLPPRVPADAIRLVAPDLDPTGIGEFTITRWLGTWEQAISTASSWIERDQPVRTSLVVDALWLALDANSLPTGGFFTGPDRETVTAVTERGDGTGTRVSWEQVTGRVSTDQTALMRTLARAIAKQRGGTPTTDGGMIVSLADEGTDQPAPRET
ncbi:MAG: hypothetical protein ACTIKT_16025 [Microbacterium sp.]